jgi:hypothetical protein
MVDQKAMKLLAISLLGVWYAATVVRRQPAGIARLLYAAPVILLQACIPLEFNLITVRGGLGFILGWLGTFKVCWVPQLCVQQASQVSCCSKERERMQNHSATIKVNIWSNCPCISLNHSISTEGCCCLHLPALPYYVCHLHPNASTHLQLIAYSGNRGPLAYPGLTPLQWVAILFLPAFNLTRHQPLSLAATSHSDRGRLEAILGSYTASIIHAGSLALKGAGLVLLTQFLLLGGVPTVVKHTCYAACE